MGSSIIGWAKTCANDLTKPNSPRPRGSALVGYTPTDWSKTPDGKGGFTYADPRLNVLQENLLVINQLLSDLRERALNDLSGEIRSNLEARTIKDPTIERIGWIMAKMVECVALAFPAGTVGAVVAGLVCRLASGGIQYITKTNQDNPDYQQAINDLHNSVDEWFSDLEDHISDWIQDLQGSWSKPYTDQDGKTIRLSEIAEHDEKLPHKGPQKEYNEWFNLSTYLVKRLMVRQLLPVQYMKRSAGMSFNEDETEYNAYWFWNVNWVEVRNSDTWDSWRRRSEWPRVPSDMRRDLEGPHEDIGNWQDIKGGHQYYQSTNGDGKVVLNAAVWDNGQYWWTRKSDNRWWYWGGRDCSSWDARTQGSTCGAVTDSNGNILKGHVFLDYVSDVLNNVGRFNICQNLGPSCLLYYELKDPRTGQIVRNSRSRDLLLNVDACKDYFYQINWFKWNWCYVGVQLRFYILTDSSGNRMNDATARWLFRDDGHGNVTNPKGIADRLDVYFNWGLSQR